MINSPIPLIYPSSAGFLILDILPSIMASFFDLAMAAFATASVGLALHTHRKLNRRAQVNELSSKEELIAEISATKARLNTSLEWFILQSSLERAYDELGMTIFSLPELERSRNFCDAEDIAEYNEYLRQGTLLT
jgi:hypothetical protein